MDDTADSGGKEWQGLSLHCSSPTETKGKTVLSALLKKTHTLYMLLTTRLYILNIYILNTMHILNEVGLQVQTTL